MCGCTQNISGFTGIMNSNIGLQPAPKSLYIGVDGNDDNADLEDDLGVSLADKKTTAQKVGGWIESLGPLADIYNKVMGKGPIDMGTSSISSSSNEEEVQTDNSWIYWTIGGVVALSVAIWAFVKFGNN
ncbi:MAG: hypothetical protein RLZZ175_2745 [Bacteroidota bacterium]|jgi:hypothetical protein